MADGWKRKMISCLNKILVVLISFPVLFVSTSFLVNIGKKMSLLGFRTLHFCTIALTSSLRTWRRRGYAAKSVEYAGRKNTGHIFLSALTAKPYNYGLLHFRRGIP